MNYDDLVRRLRNWVDDEPTCYAPFASFKKVELEAADAIASLQRDALRYRWLRGQPMLDGWALISLEIMDFNEDGLTGTLYSHDGAELDTAIDEAMQHEA